MNVLTSELFSEDSTGGNPFRSTLLEQVQSVLDGRRCASQGRRDALFQPSFASLASYEESKRPLRERFLKTLGWPLDGTPVPPPESSACEIPVAEDALGTIYRLQIPVLGPLQCYGLFFVPKGKGPFPLVITQHGGLGKAEMPAGFYGSANYNDMARRILKRGYAVFSPQLLLTWDGESDPKHDQLGLDIAFKQVGGSMAALQIYMIQRALDYLLRRPEITGDTAAMAGLSYGGFYALATAASDDRIHTAISSGFINDRFRYGWEDWTWFDSANCFMDRELCALICPRPLYLEAGKRDELFDIASAQAVGRAVGELYRDLEIPDRFAFVAHDGDHEFNKSDAPLEFLVKHFLSL